MENGVPFHATSYSIFAISIAMTLFPVLTREQLRIGLMISVRITVTVCKPSFYLYSLFCAVGCFGRTFYPLIIWNEIYGRKYRKYCFRIGTFSSFGIFAQGESICPAVRFMLFRIQGLRCSWRWGVIVNMVFDILLIGPLQHGGGLALAYSIGGIVNLFFIDGA